MQAVAMTTCKWMEAPITVVTPHPAMHSLPPCHCQEQAPALAFTLMEVKMALASSSVPLLCQHVCPVLPRSTNQPQPQPPVWTALLAISPLALAPAWLTALAVLLASMLVLKTAPPVLPRSTSLSQPHPLAWTALLAVLVRPVIGPQVALAALLASMLLLECATPALSPNTSLSQPPFHVSNAQVAPAQIFQPATGLTGSLVTTSSQVLGGGGLEPGSCLQEHLPAHVSVQT